MRVNLSFVPPDGGEQDYMMPIELPHIPRCGDYISIAREGSGGTEDFIVKRTRWNIQTDPDANIPKLESVWVECQFAVSATSSDNHRASCERYRTKTGVSLGFEDTMY